MARKTRSKQATLKRVTLKATMNKSRGRSSRSSRRSKVFDLDPFSRTAIHLINEASDLIKTSIRAGSRVGARSRDTIRKGTSSLINSTTDNVNKMIQKGATSLRHNIQRW